MQPAVVDILIHLLTVQARECLFERTMMEDGTAQVTQSIEWAQEAAQV